MRALPFVFAAFLVAACSSSPSTESDSGPDGGTNDSATTDDGSTTDDSSSGGDATTDTGGPKDSGVVDSSDGFGAVRAACINEINKLRATEGHAAYALWTSPAIDQCVNDQATYDEQKMTPHLAWKNKVYPLCNGNAQNECLGYGNTPQGIVACLNAMWNEKYQPNCVGCKNCQAQYNPNCPNCDFYGQQGMMCGHYVNMSADYFKKVACGFSKGKWSVQNFSQ